MPMTLFLQDMADKKTSFKHDSSVKRPSLSISPLKNKNEIFSPVTSNKARKDLKSSLEATIPNCLIKVPLSSKTWSEQKISWDVIPPSITDLAKVCSHVQSCYYPSSCIRDGKFLFFLCPNLVCFR